MSFITNLMIVVSLLSLGVTAQASSLRTVDADQLQTSDHTKTWLLGAQAIAISSTAIDWSLATSLSANVYTKTLGASTTFTFSNQTAGQTIVVRLTNTASNYTVTWPGGVLWSGGTAPTQTIGVHSDVYTFVYDGTNTYGSAVQNF